MFSFSSRFSPCIVVLLTPLCRSRVACQICQWEEERGQGPAGQKFLVDEPQNVSGVPRSRVCGQLFLASTILRCFLSSTNYPCTPLQVKAPKSKPHAAHVAQDVRNKKDSFLKYQKVFCAFRPFYSFPFSLPLELPLVVCYTFFGRFARFVQLSQLLPLWFAPCILDASRVLQIPRDRLWMCIQNDATTECSNEEDSDCWPHGLHSNGGQRCRPARHRGMDTREDEGCKEAAGVHSCAGRCGEGVSTCPWSCLLSALRVLHVIRGLHVRFCYWIPVSGYWMVTRFWICLPMF